MTLEILYDKLTQNNFDEFAYAYAITPDASSYHDRLIASGYRKNYLDKSDRKYHKFIRFLVDKNPTTQLLCLMVEQNYQEVTHYFDKLSVEEKMLATSRGSPLLNIALEKKDKKTILHLIEHMKPTDYLYPVMTSDFDEIKYSTVNKLENTKENTLTILTMLLDQAIHSDACLGYIFKYGFNNFEQICNQKKEYHSYPKLTLKVLKKRPYTNNQIKFNLDFINLLTGANSPEWYDTLYHNASFNYDISKDAQNLYLKISLDKILPEKENKKATKI